MQCRGKEGQGGAGISKRRKISLTSSTNEDLTYAGGLVLKHTMESGGLPTCNSRARMRTACSNIQCAATALTPQPVQNPPDTRRQCKRSKCLDITSRAPGFCRQSTARARPAVQRGSTRACARNLAPFAGVGQDFCRFESTGGPSILARNGGGW